MRDLSFLQNELAVSEQPGLDTLDPRYLAVTEQVEKEELDGAADEIEKLIAEGVYDIRLIGHYLYRAFEEGGLSAMPALLGGLGTTLSSNLEAIGPSAKRSKYVEKSLCTLFQRLAEQLEYHRSKSDGTYRDWRKSADAQTLSDAVSAGERLVAELTPPTYPQSGELLGRVLRELREVRDVSIAEEVDDEVAKESKVADEQGKDAPMDPSSMLAAGGGNDTVTLKVSPRFVELCAKLQAFETLVQKRNFEKAALVSDDLMGLIESFDPRQYFPELFASFSAQLSEHVGQVAPHWDRRETLEWKTLRQFYQVDLKSFVGGE